MKVFFHVTDHCLLKSILKHGLIPQRNRRTKHGVKVVWLTDTLENAQKIIVLSKLSDNNGISVPFILKVNLHGIKVHTYRKCKDGINEYYTTELIPPKRIMTLRY